MTVARVKNDGRAESALIAIAELIKKGKNGMTSRTIDPQENCATGATHWCVYDDNPRVDRHFGPFECQADAEAFAKQRNDMDHQISKNIFHLYDDEPGWEDAQFEIKGACDQAIHQICKAMKDFSSFGTGDTESREKIADYVSGRITLF